MDKDISLYEPDSVSTITMNDYQILKEALEEIAKCTDYPTCDIAKQALDEVDNSE